MPSPEFADNADTLSPSTREENASLSSPFVQEATSDSLSVEITRNVPKHLEAALSAGEVYTWAWDLVNERITADANLARLLGVSPEDAAGGRREAYLQAIHTEDQGRVTDAINRAVAGEDYYNVEYRVVLPDGSYRWVESRGRVEQDADGRAVSLPGVVVDITNRVNRQRQERFLAELTVRTRGLLDPEEVLYETAKAVGEYTDAHRCLYIEIDEDANTLTIRRDFVQESAGIASIAGTYPQNAFGPPIIESLRAGNITQSHDTEVDPRLSSEHRATFRATNFRAFLGVPLHRAGNWVAILALHYAQPRVWTREEADLLTIVIERTWFAVENARLYHAMQEEVELRREQGEFLRRVLESSPDCIKTLDLNGNLVSMNEGGQQVMEVDDFGVICGIDWLTFWEGETRDALRTAIATANAGGMGRFQGFCPTMKGSPRWWDVVVAPILGADGKPEQLLGISRDITFQHKAAERQRFLSELTERARRLRDVASVIEETARSVGEFIGLSRFVYADIDENKETIHVQRDWCDVQSGVESTEGLWSFADWGRFFAPFGLTPVELRDQRTVVVNDFATDPRTASEFSVAIAEQTRATMRAVVRIPLFRDGKWVAMLTAQSLEPREWSTEDVSLLETVAERTWLTLENTRLLYAAQAQVQTERARAERESLLNRIGAAVRSTLEPEAILQAAVTALGQGLGADRCYFVRYDQTRDTARVFPEWYRPKSGVTPLIGRTFQMSMYSVDRDPEYKAGRTHVVEDVVAYAPEDTAPLLELNIRAILRVPIEVGDQMTALSVAMADGPRRWTEEEVRLVENVATLVQSALEAAQIQQRERNIAQQLQAALMPSSPSGVAGFELASFYRPALSEAGVGGDFFDVFDVEKGCTALVVADLSGKGLAAASQVATVKNMLRYALYTGASVADAVTSLHRTLVEHDLLVGFATLFVGVYDHAQRTVTYVNCGQEPGLIWRAATGEIEQMSPTGPVLGGFESAEGYSQTTVNLLPRDVIVLFTDGLTEVGPSRKELLEIEGVSDLLQTCCAETAQTNTPQSVVDSLIRAVDGFARGGIPDDIALLVGVVTGDNRNGR